MENFIYFIFFYSIIIAENTNYFINLIKIYYINLYIKKNYINLKPIIMSDNLKY